MTAKRARTVKTTWEIRTYDVWGNARDGYEVNDSCSQGTQTLSIPITVNNAGTPHEFESAAPTDAQIRKVFGVKCRIETDGDDLHVTINRERDGYPIGEMTCTSHESLSPVRTIPTMETGYAFESAIPSLEEREQLGWQPWKTSPDEGWETVVHTATGEECYLGFRTIDGSKVNVWACRDGFYRAQTRLG